MTLPTSHQFLEDHKPRSSYDSADDRDDSVLLRLPKSREIPSGRAQNKTLLLLTHIATSLLTVLVTLFLTHFTRQGDSDGRCYDKFNAKCTHALPFQRLQSDNIQP